MRHSLEHQLQLPLLTKHQWLDSITAAVHRKQLHEHGTMIAKQRLMATWVVRNPHREHQPQSPNDGDPPPLSSNSNMDHLTDKEEA